MSNDKFHEFQKFILKVEGTGYTNDPDDRGGPTKSGITQGAYDDWRKKHNQQTQDVRNITTAEVSAIYYNEYWLAAGCDKLESTLALICFDTAVNTHPIVAKRLLAEAKNDPIEFVKGRVEYYNAIIANKPSQKKFENGWKNRSAMLVDTIAINKGVIGEDALKEAQQLFRKKYVTRNRNQMWRAYFDDSFFLNYVDSFKDISAHLSPAQQKQMDKMFLEAIKTVYASDKVDESSQTKLVAEIKQTVLQMLYDNNDLAILSTFDATDLALLAHAQEKSSKMAVLHAIMKLKAASTLKIADPETQSEDAARKQYATEALQNFDYQAWSTLAAHADANNDELNAYFYKSTIETLHKQIDASAAISAPEASMHAFQQPVLDNLRQVHKLSAPREKSRMNKVLSTLGEEAGQLGYFISDVTKLQDMIVYPEQTLELLGMSDEERKAEYLHTDPLEGYTPEVRQDAFSMLTEEYQESGRLSTHHTDLLEELKNSREPEANAQTWQLLEIEETSELIQARQQFVNKLLAMQELERMIAQMRREGINTSFSS